MSELEFKQGLAREYGIHTEVEELSKDDKLMQEINNKNEYILKVLNNDYKLNYLLKNSMFYERKCIYLIEFWFKYTLI